MGLFQVALAAAILQLMAAVFATIIVIIAARQGLIHRLSSQTQTDAEALFGSALPLLTWIYVLTAVGVAPTSNRFVACTAEQICRASRMMHPNQPDRGQKSPWASYAFRRVGSCGLHMPRPLLC
jgi:hypothetical protein